MTSGSGSIQFWGLTPSTNLIDFININPLDKNEDCNFILIGQCDLRHILKTLEEFQDPFNFKLNFYIIESQMELYARQLLFLIFAFEPLNSFGLEEKSIQFMELFGNVLIRPKTKKTLLILLEKLIKIITGDETLFPVHINFSKLKYRERDEILQIFELWKKNCLDGKFDIEEFWNLRVRNNLGTRYDHRMGVFDWDYSMEFKDRDEKCEIVTLAEYKTWRDSGQAYTDYDYEYSQPNVTLSSLKGRHFYGDIINGPFIPFGIFSNDESLYEKINERHKNNSFVITQAYLRNIFSKIDLFQSQILNKISFHFLSPSNAASGDNFTKLNLEYNNYFHLVYLSSSLAHYLNETFFKILKNDGVLLIEEIRFFLQLRSEQRKIYSQKIKELAEKAGFQEPFKKEEKLKNFILYEKIEK